MALFVFFFIFIIAYYIYLSNNYYSPYALLKKVFLVKRFSNIATVATYNNFYLIRADADGENYLFGVKNNSAHLTNSEILKLYEYAHKAHIHSVVLVTFYPISSNTNYRKLKQYGIEVWDYKKLIALSASTTPNTSSSSNGAISNTYSILKTSDTSDDKCKIDKNSFDPIQDGSLSEGLFSAFFDKPTRL